MNKLKEQTLSDWIPVSTPPVIEGIYQTKDSYSGQYQRYKNGFWGPLSLSVEIVARDPHMFKTSFPPTHWRGLIDL